MTDGKYLNVWDAFSSEPEELDYVLPGMISGSVGAIVGPSGMGKSFFALELATQIAGGPDLVGLGNLINGEVLYLAAEDPIDVVRHRIFKMGSHLTLEEKQFVSDNLMIESLFLASLNLFKEDDFERIKMRAKGKRLIVIDSIRLFYREEEEMALGSLRDVISRMEDICFATGCSFLFLRECSDSGTCCAPRSEVLIDDIPWQLQFFELKEGSKNKSSSNGRTAVAWRLVKHNHWATSMPTVLRRMDDGVLLSSEALKKSAA